MQPSTTASSLLKNWFLGEAASASTTTRSALQPQRRLPRVLLLDGGVSTHLESQGAAFDHRELWSSSLLLTADGRARVAAGHRDWLGAGCVNLVSTVTYQCHYEAALWPTTPPNDGSSSNNNENNNVIVDEAHMDDLWRRAVQLATDAVLDDVHDDYDYDHDDDAPLFRGVVASTGCFGAALANGAEYTGDYGDRTADDLKAFHARKLQTVARLAESPGQGRRLRLDGVAIETVPSLAECQALRDLFCNDEASPLSPSLSSSSSSSSPPPPSSLACWISLACRNGRELNDGTPVQTALDVLSEIPVDRVQALGFNCCAATELPDLVDRLLDHYVANRNADSSSSSSIPQRGIVLYPNSGEVWNAQRQDWEADDKKCRGGHGGHANHDDAVAVLMECLRRIDDKAGLPSAPRVVVGGCCRTTPADMAALRRRVDAYLNGKGG